MTQLFFTRLITLVLTLLLSACGNSIIPASAPEPTLSPPAPIVENPLDLRTLPTLDVSAQGQQSAVVVMYETRADIPAAVAFYRPLLVEQGWEEHPDQGYVQETSALMVFTQQGFYLTASFSDLGATRAVSLYNHGNFDVRTLPTASDSSLLFEQPSQLIYLTDQPVMEIARFTREALEAQGWHFYQRPFTSYAEESDSQQLSFIRGAINLNVHITIAPAQGNKTSIQYTAQLLPSFLPVADDATDLLFAAEQPYLSYTTALNLGEIAVLYISPQPELGWQGEVVDGMTEGSSPWLAFRHNGQRLILELARTEDGHTTVLLSPDPDQDYDPALPEATMIIADATPAIEAFPTTAALPTRPTITGSLPAPPNATITRNAPGELEATSPDDLVLVLSFYREALPEQGWYERLTESTIDERSATLVFERDAILIKLVLRRTAGDQTAISITTTR